MTAMTIETLDATEAASRLGVHPTTLSSQIASGRLRLERFRDGKRYLYLADSVERVARQRERERAAKVRTTSPNATPSSSAEVVKLPTALTVAPETTEIKSEIEALLALAQEALDKLRAAL